MEPVFDDPGPDPDPLAVVTGAGGLLGACTAVELAARGWPVALVGREPAALAEATGSVRDAVPGARVVGLRCDLAESDEVADAVAFVERLDRPVGMVVHAAGLHGVSSVLAAGAEDLDEHYLVDVRGPYVLTQGLVPLMGPRSRCVVLAGSPSATRRDAHQAITSAALVAFAAELRTELARRGVGVLTVRTDDPADGAGAVRALAAVVVDAATAEHLDVTELRVRPGVA